jgi:cytochrome c556
MRKLLALSLTLIMTSIISLPVSADDYDAEAMIKYRQNSMDAIKGHNNAIKAILEGKVPQKDQLGMHMAALEALLGHVDTLFPEGSDFGDTDAKDAVWDKPEKFSETVKKAQQAFADFKAVADKGDSRASLGAFKKFGKNSCGNCHKSFKKKDDDD